MFMPKSGESFGWNAFFANRCVSKRGGTHHFVNFGMYGYEKGFAYGPTAGKPGTNNYINLLLMLFRYSP